MIYVLLCETWGGTSYSTEIICAFDFHHAAEIERKALQGNTPTCDIRYYIEKVELL